MITTMTDLFASIFQHDDVLEWARELGALKRLRDIHPADLCLAITHCAMGDETRSIATARRAFFTLTGFMPEESSFYDRFNEGSVALMKRLFERAVAAGSFEQREGLDVDADFTVRKRGSRTFRVVRVPVSRTPPDGRCEIVHLWFVTNLPPELFSPRQLATIYRFRWEMEQLFRTLKTVGRLDHLRSANPHVIHTFIYATLLAMVLSHDICALMRRKRPGVEPSPYRVTSLLLMFLPSIIAGLGTRKIRRVLKTFENALWREGANPNPGRSYRATLYAEELRNAA